MPEPTTAATRMRGAERLGQKAPRERERFFAHSAAVAGVSPACLGLADGLQLLLQSELVERADRQADENRDAVVEHPERVGEGEPDFSLVAGGGCGIGNAPMRGHRLARPHRAGLGRRVVANREHEIELRRVRPGELAPVLGAKAADVEIELAQEIDRIGVNSALRLAAGREGAKFSPPLPIQDGFGHDRARRIAGAEKEDVERLSVGSVRHGYFLRWLLFGAGGQQVVLAQRLLQIANFGMPVATIGDQEALSTPACLRRRRGRRWIDHRARPGSDRHGPEC